MASVSELESEVAETRERLSATIDRIQSKLTVSGIVDEFMGQAGVPSTQAGQDVILGLLRRHPVPVMVAAAGIGFLIYRMNRRADRIFAAEAADADLVDVPVVNDGRARGYDPDLPTGRREPDLADTLQARA